ncbi:dUTP diphosphatase [Halobacillus litoralis]|uniref:dUTP diphosphatase n=1 Tax=Halobacillus litoralis TaxID=45668 RepID=UPI001CFE36B1|nr:dUTP diphosphatase [Halobacillus litoralis]
MLWESLYTMQGRLDEYIENQHKLYKGEKVQEKILALLVELGELANETRCFKFWSTKGPSDKAVILEEFVDGVHFLLSIGLDLDLRFVSQSHNKGDFEQTESFLKVYEAVERFRLQQDAPSYNQMFSAYLNLGLSLGITEDELRQAYENKNRINFERQDQGY